MILHVFIHLREIRGMLLKILSFILKTKIANYRIVTHIKNDPLLNNVRNEPEFSQIVNSMETNYDSVHNRVKKWIEEEGNF